MCKHLLILSIPIDPILHFGDIVSHIQPKLSHLPIFYQSPVFSLSLSRCRSYSVPPCLFLCRQFLSSKTRRWRLGFWLVLLLGRLRVHCHANATGPRSPTGCIAVVTIPLSSFLRCLSAAFSRLCRWLGVLVLTFPACARELPAVEILDCGLESMLYFKWLRTSSSSSAVTRGDCSWRGSDLTFLFVTRRLKYGAACERKWISA